MVALMMEYEVMVTDGTLVVDCISLTGDAFIRGVTRLTVMNMNGNSSNQPVNGGDFGGRRSGFLQ